MDRSISVCSGSTASARKVKGSLARERGKHGAWSDEEEVGKSARKKAKSSTRRGRSGDECDDEEVRKKGAMI